MLFIQQHPQSQDSIGSYYCVHPRLLYQVFVALLACPKVTKYFNSVTPYNPEEAFVCRCTFLFVPLLFLLKLAPFLVPQLHSKIFEGSEFNLEKTTTVCHQSHPLPTTKSLLYTENRCHNAG